MAEDPWAFLQGPAAPPVPPPTAQPAPSDQATVDGPAPPVAAPTEVGSWAFLQGPANADSGGGLSAEQVATGKDPQGRPLQFLSATPDNDPVGQTLGQPIAENKIPGIATQAIASLPTDAEERRRVVAGQLFPDLPPLEGESRVFYGTDGRLAAVGHDGKPFYVDPEAIHPISRPSTVTPTNLVNNIGGMAGPAIPAVAGMASGMLAGPTSLVVGPAAAGAGAAAGDAARQYAGRYFDPRPDEFHYNGLQTAGEAAGAATGQAAGALVLRGISPNRLGASNPDIVTLRAGRALPEAERLNALAEAQGVHLTPGQASGLPSLLAHEDVINSGAAGPGLSDIARAKYQEQGREIAAAGQTMLDRVSPATDKTDAAMQFQQGAEDATRLTRQNANAAARPSYDAAQRVGNVMSPDLAQLADTPAVQGALTRARVEYQNLYRRAAPETPDFALWDLAKRQLDDAHGIARRAGENTTAMAVDSVRGDLVTHLDAAYPTYANARATAAPGQRLASRLDSVVGSAVGDGTERARAIVAPVIEGNNPRAITEARDAFTAAGRGDEWNAGIRSYIQDAFDKAGQSQAGLNPSSLRRQVWGNVDNRASIQAALDPAAYQGFDNFMQTVEAAARTYPIGSLTAPRMEAKNALLEAAGNTPGVRVAKTLGTLTDPFGKGIHIGGSAFDAVAKWATRRNLENISERLFSREGMDYLRTMGNLSPRSQKAISATAEFIGQKSGRSIASDASAPLNQLLQQPANR